MYVHSFLLLLFLIPSPFPPLSSLRPPIRSFQREPKIEVNESQQESTSQRRSTRASQSTRVNESQRESTVNESEVIVTWSSRDRLKGNQGEEEANENEFTPESTSIALNQPNLESSKRVNSRIHNEGQHWSTLVNEGQQRSTKVNEGQQSYKYLWETVKSGGITKSTKHQRKVNLAK